MMNVKNTQYALLLAASAVSLALTGCGGDDGTDGTPGNPGGPAADVVNILNLDVTKVTYQDGMPTIEVFATNEEELPVVGLKDLEVKAVAQLLPQGSTGAGDSAQWQKIGAEKTFTDHKNGNYSFTIALEGYNSELTQRYNVIASASTLQDGVTSVPRTELSEDFSGDGYQALYSKDIVSTETCASCHAAGEAIYHSYTSAETCTSCHTQEMADDKDKPQVVFNHLIHNVHNDAKMYGRNLDDSAEKAHGLLQDNCQTCHLEPDADSGELTEWGNWTRVPTMETCTSCHVDIDFKAGQGHSQQNDNSNCIACHNPSWTEELHMSGFVDKKALIDQYAMEATLTALATGSGSDTTLSITISGADGVAIDAATLLANIEQLESITNVGPNFPIMGYNSSPGNGEHKVLIKLVENGVLADNAQIIDGRLVTTIANLPYGEGDTDTAFSFIGLALCNEGTDLVPCGEGVDSTSMKAELAHGTLSGEAPSVRHTDSVNFGACESCHGTEWELHQDHHAGFVMTEQLGRINQAGEMIVGVDGCVACHTPDGTYASGANKGALEMKLHSLHSSGDYGIISGMTCSQCHNDFNLDAFKVKGALATSAGLYSTPIAATCSSCHSHSDSFKTHAEGQGAIIDGSYEAANDAAQLESCFLCHNPSINDHTSVKM